ncbi:MAG TPA: cysteine peptidase family C39 domain-containing protein [Polyangiaceae bacterium]|nr:cysteine peptidase family C39 domain-containing protein [Polyangiaceae bacterium]
MFRRQIRPVQQLEAAECGVASLAMVLDYFGASIPLDELRDLCGTSRDGNNARQLIDTAKSLGLEACGLKLPIEQLKTAQPPLLLHWRMNHYVVLEGFRGDRACIVDPATGRMQVESDELSRSFSGIAVMFSPTKKLRRRKRVSPGFGRFFAELRTGTGAVVFLAVAGALSQLLGILWPALQQVLVDEVLLPRRANWLMPILLVQIGVVLAMLALSWQHQTMLLRLRTALVARLTNQLGRKLLRVPLTFIEMRSRGDLLQRVSGYSGLADLLAHSVEGVFQLLFAAALAALMLAYDAQLAAVALALDLVHILIVRRLREETRQRSAGELTARGAEASIVMQAASSGDVVQAFRMEQQLEKWYANCLEERQSWTVRASRLVRGTGAWLSIFDGITQWLVFGLGGARVIHSEITLGVFAGFLAIRGLLRGPLTGLVHTFESWLEFRGVIHRSDDVFRQELEPSGDRKPPSNTPVLELKNVGFRFSAGSPWLFRGVSLRIEVGQNVTLVGPSGQGKSTLLRILGGVLSPTEGQVLLDGVELCEFDRESLGEKIGAVVGAPVLVDGTVRENLRLRRPNSNDEELREAARIACFDEVAARLRSGYGTLLSGHAPPFSGGELQRLGLAQALIGRPSILLLDEATSFLDAETEARVIRNTLQARTTLISVAHRPAVIETSDLVYRIEAGRVTREAARSTNSQKQLTGRIVRAEFGAGASAA